MGHFFVKRDIPKQDIFDNKEFHLKYAMLLYVSCSLLTMFFYTRAGLRPDPTSRRIMCNLRHYIFRNNNKYSTHAVSFRVTKST